ncbi:MAG: TlyA family RNA methyltransferase [Coriobacteriia bacterium]|nr:TlyA family RNA methyltransferase [Coriobacteriia bacterium]
MAKKRYTGPYVSRGGEKLRGALLAFDYYDSVQGLRALDVGASTGGFTDCLLQAGASHVTAFDVAYGQFAWKLRQDPRVTVLERTNFRTANFCELEDFEPPFDLVVADLSFISLVKLVDQFKVSITKQHCCSPRSRHSELQSRTSASDGGLSSGGDLILLVKPQFEALREEVPRGGVITDPELHLTILQRLARSFLDAGLVPVDWTYSPIKGPRGNIEFWLWARKEDTNSKVSESEANCATIEEVVSNAHADLS